MGPGSARWPRQDCPTHQSSAARWWNWCMLAVRLRNWLRSLNRRRNRSGIGLLSLREMRAGATAAWQGSPVPCKLRRGRVGSGMVPDDIKPTVRRSRSRTERRLIAVLGLDILGYSILMGRGEEQVHRRVGAELERVCREAERSHGRVFTFAGDSVMAEFPSAVEALRCAMRI